MIKKAIVAPIVDVIFKPITEEFFFDIKPTESPDFRVLDFNSDDFKTG